MHQFYTYHIAPRLQKGCEMTSNPVHPILVLMYLQICLGLSQVWNWGLLEQDVLGSLIQIASLDSLIIPPWKSTPEFSTNSVQVANWGQQPTCLIWYEKICVTAQCTYTASGVDQGAANCSLFSCCNSPQGWILCWEAQFTCIAWRITSQPLMLPTFLTVFGYSGLFTPVTWYHKCQFHLKKLIKGCEFAAVVIIRMPTCNRHCPFHFPGCLQSTLNTCYRKRNPSHHTSQ